MSNIKALEMSFEKMKALVVWKDTTNFDATNYFEEKFTAANADHSNELGEKLKEAVLGGEEDATNKILLQIKNESVSPKETVTRIYNELIWHLRHEYDPRLVERLALLIPHFRDARETIAVKPIFDLFLGLLAKKDEEAVAIVVNKLFNALALPIYKHLAVYVFNTKLADMESVLAKGVENADPDSYENLKNSFQKAKTKGFYKKDYLYKEIDTILENHREDERLKNIDAKNKNAQKANRKEQMKRNIITTIYIIVQVIISAGLVVGSYFLLSSLATPFKYLIPLVLMPILGFLLGLIFKRTYVFPTVGLVTLVLGTVAMIFMPLEDSPLVSSLFGYFDSDLQAQLVRIVMFAALSFVTSFLTIFSLKPADFEAHQKQKKVFRHLHSAVVAILFLVLVVIPPGFGVLALDNLFFLVGFGLLALVGSFATSLAGAFLTKKMSYLYPLLFLLFLAVIFGLNFFTTNSFEGMNIVVVVVGELAISLVLILVNRIFRKTFGYVKTV